MKIKKFLLFVGMLALIIFFSGTQIAAAYTHTVTLKSGSQSMQVLELQRALNSAGYTVAAIGAGSPGMESMNFGPKTKAAVMRFQAAQGLYPIDGIVGPMTGTRIAALSDSVPTPNPTPTPCPVGYTCTPAQPPTDTPSSGLSGTNGDIADFKQLSPYSNEEVGAGQKDVRVAGFKIKASNGGDIAIRTVRVSFDPTGNTGSNRLNRYVSSVSLWMGTHKIATVPVDDFSRDRNDVYSRSIAINDAIIRSNTSEDFFITVDAAQNLNSTDINGDSWTVDIDSIRYEDGSHALLSDNSTGDIDNLNVPINFTTFSDVANTKLKIATASDNPKEGLIIVDTNRSTSDVVLLKGTLKVDGKSDVTIDELPVTLTVGGTASDVDTVVRSVTLKIGNQKYNESISSTGISTVVTFDRLDYKITAGKSVTFTVLADISNIRPGVFDEGDTISAEISSANRDEIEAENERGDDLSNSNEKSGTAIGQTMELRTNGITLQYVSSNAKGIAVSGMDNDFAQFSIRFKVAAVGEDIYIAATPSNAGIQYAIDKGGVPVTSGYSAVVVNMSNSNLTPEGNYIIRDGDEETLELTAVVNLPEAGTTGLYRMSLTGIQWDTDDDATPDNDYTFNLSQFRTDYVVLN